MTISKEYFVQVQGKTIGPLTHSEILHYLQKKQILFHHYLYSWNRPYWRMIGEDEAFISHIPSYPPKLKIVPRHIYFYREKLQGPFTIVEMEQKVEAQEISLFDFVFVEEEGSWCRMKNSPLFQHLLPLKPQETPLVHPEKKEILSNITFDIDLLGERHESIGSGKQTIYDEKFYYEVSSQPIWMVKKGEQILGPYRYIEISRMIKSGLIDSFHLIKKIDQEKWAPIGDVYEFKTKMVRKLIKSGPQLLEKTLVARKHGRIPFIGQVKMVIEGKKYVGTCTTLSEGGVFVELRVDGLKVDQRVEMEIMPTLLPETISSKGHIIGLKRQYPQGIIIEFDQIDPVLQKNIQQMIKNFAPKIGEKG